MRLVQFGLNALGYPSGLVDGIEGAQTADAIRKFNASRGATGSAIDDAFLERLFLELDAAGHFRRLEQALVPSPPSTGQPSGSQQGHTYPTPKVPNIDDLRSRAAKAGGAVGAFVLLGVFLHERPELGLLVLAAGGLVVVLWIMRRDLFFSRPLQVIRARGRAFILNVMAPRPWERPAAPPPETPRNLWKTYGLWLPFGLFVGAHRVYLGDHRNARIWLGLTVSIMILGLIDHPIARTIMVLPGTALWGWWIVDGVRLPGMVKRRNDEQVRTKS